VVGVHPFGAMACPAPTEFRGRNPSHSLREPTDRHHQHWRQPRNAALLSGDESGAGILRTRLGHYFPNVPGGTKRVVHADQPMVSIVLVVRWDTRFRRPVYKF